MMYENNDRPGEITRNNGILPLLIIFCSCHNFDYKQWEVAFKNQTENIVFLEFNISLLLITGRRTSRRYWEA